MVLKRVFVLFSVLRKDYPFYYYCNLYELLHVLHGKSLLIVPGFNLYFI